MKSVDLTSERVVSGRDVVAAIAVGAREIVVAEQAALTITAREALRRNGCTLRRESGGVASADAAGVANEIVAVGRKLWLRQYVDGNGGNISCRTGDGLVMCTPTLVSKGDLRPEDLCLVDLAGRQVGGTRPITSEIRMHLEIYRAVPEARAVVHAHPPHATAYAVTGRVPTRLLIPEYEVFIGQVALTRYETPGTQAFAESLLPYVRTHNTVLLANHGVVCWAESVTRAEWLTEILDTYCWILQLASQMRAPLTRIPRAKAVELAAIRRRIAGQEPRRDTTTIAGGPGRSLRAARTRRAQR